MNPRVSAPRQQGGAGVQLALGRMGQAITFGTDGWRAVIADGFTFDTVRRVSEAIAVAAHVLAWMWRPWLPGVNGYSALDAVNNVVSMIS